MPRIGLPMKVAVISIGDELMYGETVDSNFTVIAGRLYDAGLPVAVHLTVGDDREEIARALVYLAREHEVIIATGGLGPTSDDLTAAAAAEASGCPLQLSGAALEHIRQVAGRWGAEVPPANEKQALVPAGATLIDNPDGTACGFIVPLGRCRSIFLPGVPREMARMLSASVLPLLAPMAGGKTYLTKVFMVFGPSEAELETLLASLDSADSGVSVAYCVAFPGIQVKLRAFGESEPPVVSRLESAARLVRDILGDRIVAEDGESLDTVIAGLLRSRGETLSLAESCTGGLLAERITDLAGCSAYFLEGVVSYANAAKERLLGVSPLLLAERGAVSADVAIAMAEGSRRSSGSDHALAVTGIAGPDGGTPEKPVGTVFIAVADRDGCTATRHQFTGDRHAIRSMTTFTALNLLRLRLMKGKTERHP
jgi:nicotinamide-nucleotide amidase